MSFFSKTFDEKAKSLALVRWARSDQEFLPAALSILETPASPVRIGLLWTICLLMGFAILLGYFGRIDILAVAQGKIQPTGRVKTIQPLETGRVVAIHVENGQHVNAGEALVELDPAEAIADEQAAMSALAAYKAERLRRRAALAAAESSLEDDAPRIAWPQDAPPAIREREQRVLDGDLRQLRVSALSYDAQIAQKKDEERRLENTIRAEKTLIDTLAQRVAMRRALLARGSTPKAAVLDALESLQTQETQLATQKGQLQEARAAQEVLAQEREKSIDGFIADNGQKLGEAERQIDDLEQKFAKAHVKTGHMTLTSPISGTVLGLSVTTKNQVLTTSEELMRVVPDDAGLEIEAYLENKDIGFVASGQAAIVKVESFPFTRFGTLDAFVTRVAHDAIPQADAQSVEGNPAKPPKNDYFGGAQRVQNLYFPVTLRTERASMSVEGAEIPLSPGMAATVEIKTGKRRILEYLFSPLVETASRAMRER
ncbi:MAG TPA: HlyD family type I secretion periplasmic adaptor subunit [Methylocystis sp.]|nr:HlyD family type I secretion periplasmic adaptor subunit [Methylocystis sp.]